MNTAGSSDNDLRTILEGLHVLANTGTANASMALDAHEVADSNDDLLNLLSQFTGGGKNERLALLHIGIDLLENGNGESSGLASTGLGLRNDIVTCRVLVSGKKKDRWKE